MPQVCCHGARRCSADFPGRNKKPYVLFKFHLGGGYLLTWAVFRFIHHFFPLHSHCVSHELPVSTRVGYLLQFACTWCTSNLAKLVRWWLCQSIRISETHLCSLCPVPLCVGGNNTSFSVGGSRVPEHSSFTCVKKQWLFLPVSVQHQAQKEGWPEAGAPMWHHSSSKHGSMWYLSWKSTIIYSDFFCIWLYTLLEILHKPSQRNYINCLKCKPDTVNLGHL